MDYFSIGIGSIFILVGLYLFVNRLLFKRNTIVTYGTVMGNVHKRAFFPIIEFVDAAEQKHTFTGDIGSRPASHQPGDRVRVRYHPEFPNKARLETSWQWIIALISILAGIVVVMLSFPFFLQFSR